MKMNYAIKCFIVFLLIVVAGCSQSNQSDQSKKSTTTKTTAIPSPPSTERAEALIVGFVERTGALKVVNEFLKMQPGLADALPTVIAENIEIGAFDSEEKLFPVDAYIVLAGKFPNGEIRKLDRGTASAAGYPDIPGNWKLSFKSSGSDQWQVGLLK